MNKPHVLIVEDDAHLRHLLRIRLEGMGCEVAESDTPEDALQHENGLNLLLLDLKLQVPDGKELLVKLRERGNFVPTVVISGSGDDKLRREVEALQIVYWLGKPFKQEMFTKVVREALKTAGDIEAVKEASGRLSLYLTRMGQKLG